MNSLTFLINDSSTGGQTPIVQVQIVENTDGTVTFTLTQLAGYVGDLRGLFFDVADESLIGTLTATGTNLTELRQGDDSITDLGGGANMQGLVGDGGGYDVGVEIGSSGLKTYDDIRTFTFTLDSSLRDITLADFSSVAFGARITSVGLDSNLDGSFETSRTSSSKTGEVTFRVISPTKDAAAVSEDTAATGNLLANDGAGSGDQLSVTGWSGGSLGVTYAFLELHYATIRLDADGSYTIDASAADTLAAGQSASHTFTYNVLQTNVEGTSTHTVSSKVTITGTNDAPLIGVQDVSGAVTELVTPAGTLTDTGVINFSDLDLTDVHLVSATGTPLGSTLGTLTATKNSDTTGTGIGGALAWTYSVDAAAVEYLAVGETKVESFTITLDDQNGGLITRQIDVTITGTNDAAVISSESRSITESNAAQTVSGTLSVTDVDSPQTFVAQSVTAGAFGTFSIDAAGAWSYAMNAAHDELATGQVVTETFSVTSADGTTQAAAVTVTITGTNDAPTITSGAQAATVVEDAAPALVNAGFESPEVGANTFGAFRYNPTGAGWTFAGTSGVTGNKSGFTSANPSAPDPDQVAFLQSGTTPSSLISQSVTMTAGTYAIQFQAAQRATGGGGENPDQLDFEVLLDGISLGVVRPPSTSYSTFTVTGSVATDGVHTLAFRPINSRWDTDATAFIDNVKVDALSHLRTGQVSFADVDLLDTHTATSAPQGSGYRGTFALGGVNQAGDTVGWSFSVDDSALENLAAGQTLTQKYDVTVADGHGGSATQTVTVTLTGTNDAPVVAVVDVSAAVTELSTQSVSAPTGLSFTNMANITLANAQRESGGDTTDNPNAVNGKVGALLAYTASGTFPEAAPYRVDNLNDGDIGLGVASDGTYAIPLAGTNSLTLAFGAPTLVGSIAIYNGYGNRDDGTYTLKDGSGNVLGAWTVSGTGGATNDGVHSFWLTLNTPVTTDKLVLATTSSDASNTNSYREIQVFGVPNLTDSGTIAFSDIDLADVHSVSAVAPAAGALGTLTASVTADTTGTGTGGVVSWNYSVAASAVDYLAAGQTKTESFSFNVLDGQGGSVGRTVAATITGVNDAPTDLVYAAVLPASGTALPGANSVLATLSTVDPDPGNTFTYSIASGGAGFAISGSSLLTTTGLSTSSTYNFTLRSTDSGGLSVDQAIRILTGTNGTDSSLPGGTGDDVIYALDSPIPVFDVLLGGAGNDTLFGQNGQDNLVGGTGDDYMYGGVASDVYTVDPASGNDIISEASGNGTDAIVVDAANVNFSADNFGFERLDADGDGALDDLLHWYGTAQLAVLNQFVAGQSIELVRFRGATVEGFGLTSQNNFLTLDSLTPIDGGANMDLVVSSSAGETLNGFGESDKLFGNGGDDILNGGAFDDLLVGGSGNDVLDGGSENDLLIGGTGNDTLIGGTGADRFYFGVAGGDGVDTVTDFATGTSGDKLDLRDVLQTFSGYTAAGAFTGGYLKFDSDGGTGTLVRVDSNGGGDSFTTLAHLTNTLLTQADSANYII